MSLEVKEISKQYGAFTALHPLSFTLSEPGVYALLGTNGAGKTTAIRIILGMLSRNSDRDRWKLAHWDEYISKINFNPPENLRVPDPPDSLIIFNNSSNDEFRASLNSVAARLERGTD